ncbi:MAG: UvrD-helicase domain-containing protein [Bacteroidaceae bacterium]|nr:UvrD-helicase domain-containing protein [Bacteroidaceae bacterium]
MNIDDLNPSQREAVLCSDAPSLVIAGAGSGKTRVLTYKIAYLLEQGMQPWNILALTFTNKAAREMRERIATLVSLEKASALWMGTFHSIFARILRTEGHRLGYDTNYTIYDTDDSKSLIRLILREMCLDEKVYKPTAVQNRISAAKNRLVLPSAYNSVREFRESDDMAKRTLMPEIYQRYQDRCKQANAMDFDDLLLNTWLLFDRNPEVAQQWQDRFHFVLVDEYQDTNFAQHQIIRLLTDRRQRVCVVGDDAQSIYSFRGADIDNILRFQETYPGARLFKLERNYRSTQTIVNAAGSLIRNNREQIAKQVFSEKEVGNPIALFPAYSDIDEANIILREVQKAHRSGIPYKDITVLYRTNAQSRKIEDSFLHGRVPYHIYAGMSFYQREEIKDLLCYLRLSVNPYDEESLRRIINKPARGIGDTTVRKLFLEARKTDKPVWDVLGSGSCPDVNAGTLARLKTFYSMMAAFHESSTADDAHTLAMRIAKESGLMQHVFSGHDPDDISKQENMQEMLDGIANFVQDSREQGLGTSLGDFLQEASLATDFDRNDIDKDDDSVNMMTIHSAKGLEFPIVFITGLEEGLFPSEMTSGSPRALEEERRLFYVAITRAERQVVLTYAKSRFRNGKMEFSRPSRFIREIPQQYYSPLRLPQGSETVQRQTPRVEQRLKPIRPQGAGSFVPPSCPSFMPPSAHSAGSITPSPSRGREDVGTALSVGTPVVHERFGRGVVQALEGTGIDAKATVQFENAGTKVLMLRFAKLTVL